MNSSKFAYIFFTLSIILIFSHSLIPASCKTLYESVYEDNTLNGNNSGKLSKNLVECLCDAMRMRESCQRLLKSNPELASAKNYVDLANSLLDLGIRKATDGQVYISNFNKKNQHRALQRCATTLYPESIQLFKKAKANLVKDPKAANSDALDAGLRTHECTTVIVFDNINVPGTIVDINNNVFFLGEIASYAASMLLK